MRFKLTIVLLLANLAVFFALWRLDRPTPITLQPSGLVNFQPNHITINDHLRNEVRELVQNPGGAWRLVKPVDWSADETSVQHLINRLVKPDELSHFSADDIAQTTNPLGEYGLDKPRLEITVTGSKKGETVTLEVGNSTPSGDNLYVMNPADRQVRVWTQEFFDIVETPVKDLRDNSIFSLLFFDISDLSIKSPKLVKFSRDSHNNEFWQLDTPLQRPANSKNVNGVVQQLYELKAVNFLTAEEANPARTGLDSPILRVELKGDNRSQALLVGKPVPNITGDPQYYAKRDDSDVVFTISPPRDLLETLTLAQERLRERRFLVFDPEKVTDIAVKVSDAELRLSKSEDGAKPWQILTRDAVSKEPTTVPADKSVVLALLESLGGLAANSFASDAPDDLKTYGLAQPLWKVTLKVDKTPIVLDVGQTGDTPPYHYYAKVENSDSVYEIDGDIVGELSQAIDPLHFRDRTLETLPPTANIVSLKLTHLKDDGTEDGDPIINFPADPARSLDEQLKDKPENLRQSILALRKWLHSASVDGYLKASFDEHTAFQIVQGNSLIPLPAPWHYRLDVGIQTPGAGQAPAKNQTLTFYFTEQIDAHQYGGTHTPEAIFDLPISIISILGVLTRNASLPPMATETLRQQDQPIDPRNPSPAPAQTTAPSASTAAPASSASTTPATTP